jgi:hypothetical protein
MSRLLSLFPRLVMYLLATLAGLVFAFLLFYAAFWGR